MFLSTSLLLDCFSSTSLNSQVFLSTSLIPSCPSVCLLLSTVPEYLSYSWLFSCTSHLARGKCFNPRLVLGAGRITVFPRMPSLLSGVSEHLRSPHLALQVLGLQVTFLVSGHADLPSSSSIYIYLTLFYSPSFPLLCCLLLPLSIPLLYILYPSRPSLEPLCSFCFFSLKCCLLAERESFRLLCI